MGAAQFTQRPIGAPTPTPSKALAKLDLNVLRLSRARRVWNAAAMTSPKIIPFRLVFIQFTVRLPICTGTESPTSTGMTTSKPSPSKIISGPTSAFELKSG